MTSFGEIVEPDSRAAWEDWDEVNPDGHITMLQWQAPLTVPDKIETLFLLEGKFLADSVKGQSKEHLKLVNSIAEAYLNLYQIQSQEKYICSVKDYNLLYSSEIVELLKPLICKSDDVISIQTKPLMEYQQTMTITNQPWPIRKITTTKTSSNSLYNLNYANLEQPNILSGIGAGALCLQEQLNLPATVLVYYIENIEEYQTAEIYNLLKKIHIIEKSTSKYEGILSSNLYI